MTDEQIKECTAKFKGIGDIRPLTADDADSIMISIVVFNMKRIKDLPMKLNGRKNTGTAMRDRERRFESCR